MIQIILSIISILAILLYLFKVISKKLFCLFVIGLTILLVGIVVYYCFMFNVITTSAPRVVYILSHIYLLLFTYIVCVIISLFVKK